MSSESLRHVRFGFIGAGNIAGALIERLLKSGTVPADGILASDPNSTCLEQARRNYGIRVSLQNAKAVDFADDLFLAVPPDAVSTVLLEIRERLSSSQLIISLAAGITTAAIEQTVAIAMPVIRVVPNLPSVVGQGVNPYCLGRNVKPADHARAAAVLAIFGDYVRLTENQMNTVTALSAIGPAYLLSIMKSLAEAAVKHGLTEHEARYLVARLMRGTAELVRLTSEDTEELKLKLAARGLNEQVIRNVFADAFEKALDEVAGSEKALAAVAA